MKSMGCISAIFVLLLAGCGTDRFTTPKVSNDELVAQGWQEFEEGAAGPAAALFRQCLRDDSLHYEAHVGLGWSLLRLDSLSASVGAFDEGLHTGGASSDLFAGRAIALRDLGPGIFELAIASAESALAREPRYAFVHDAAITWWELRLLLAQSYFALDDWTRAGAEVDSLGGVVPDPGSKSYVADLLEEIQRLSLEGRGTT